jgi:hypothetical protein
VEKIEEEPVEITKGLLEMKTFLLSGRSRIFCVSLAPEKLIYMKYCKKKQ